MKIIKYFLLIIFIVLFYSIQSSACTTAVISGKFTKDGRPLLWKQRDSKFMENKLMYFNDGKYEYIGLVNSQDSTGREIWAGCNSAGFAIMNSASYNLNIGDTTGFKDQEGFVMKKALQTCASVQDFEQLLHELPKPIGCESNFGVIDASGGVAFYETGNFSYTKFDANDPKTAPLGYIIRANYSFAGEEDKGKGYIRYLTAEKLFHQAAAENNLSARFIINDCSRCLKHSLTGDDLRESLPADSDKQKLVNFQDYIPRFISAASVIVQGVSVNEPPSLTTMWTILGFPLCSVAVPVWVNGGNSLPEILTANSGQTAPLCDMALTLKNKCFPIRRGSGKKYLNLAAVLTQNNSGIMQKLHPLENRIIKETVQKLSRWRKNGLKAEEAQKYYRWLDKIVFTEYNRLFGVGREW